MNRSEHLQWSKDRAIECLNRGERGEAFASFNSDMSKHDDLMNHKALEMGMMLLIGGQLTSDRQMKDWINGFN
jgi:hypothetical protein